MSAIFLACFAFGVLGVDCVFSSEAAFAALVALSDAIFNWLRGGDRGWKDQLIIDLCVGPCW